MNLNKFRQISQVKKDTLIKGNEILIVFAREEGARYESSLFLKHEISEAYNTIERYKKTGELELEVYRGIGRVAEIIRPVSLLVSEVTYGYRMSKEIIAVKGLDSTLSSEA